MQDTLLAKLQTIQRILALLVTLVGLVIGVNVADQAAEPDATTTIVKTKTVEPPPAAPPATAVDGPDADTKRDDAIPLDAEAQELLEAKTDPGGQTDPESVLREPDDGTVAGVIEGPLAAPEWPGCRTAFVRNFSSRAGVKPRVIVWHQTVSRENGLSSQNALTALANSPRAQVSWHFLIGRSNGLCTYTVPTDLKAWTQAESNPYSLGIEVEAYGDEAIYVTGAGKAKLLAVTRRLGKLYGIPMRRGLVSECRLVRSGIVEHKDLDQRTSCAGGHADVNLPGTSALIAELAAGAGGNPRRHLTAREAELVECLERQRRTARRHGGWSNVDPLHLRRAVACKRALRAKRALIKRNGNLDRYHRRARLQVLYRVIHAA